VAHTNEETSAQTFVQAKGELHKYSEDVKMLRMGLGICNKDHSHCIFFPSL